jgi:hypothetical protein
VVVAGNEVPDFALPKDPRFKFISLDHSDSVMFPKDSYWVAAVRDKMAKISVAWDYAKVTWSPQYVMKVDWDDLISSRLVDWLYRAKNEAGYLIKHGWIWRPKPRFLIQRTEQFDRFCGTCLIIRSDLTEKTGPFLTSVDGTKFDEAGRRFEAENRYALVPGAGVGKLLLTGNHTRSQAQFAYLGYKLGVVPFSAAIYRIGHGNNASGHYHCIHSLRMLLGRIRRTRVITANLRKEFMLE